jgi:hypothetical protein
MSKKTKKQVRKGNAATLQTVQPKPGEVVASAFISSARPSEKEFNPDYTPIVKDLKRIGSLASIFIVILVALSFFLR